MSSTRAAVGGVSVRGSSHAWANRPNQDAVGHAREGAWSYLAVADGHGAARHHRSDRGAAFAVETALALLRAASSRLGEGQVVSSLADDLVGGWRARVEDDIRARPLRERAGFDSLAVYGATCLAAAIGPGLALFLQIGDGDMLASARAGEVDRAIASDPHLAGAATYSLCQTDASRRVHIRLFAEPHPLSTPDFVMAATDGLFNSYREQEAFLAVPRSLRETLRTTPLQEVLPQLESWLGECSRLGSRDDISVAIFSGTS